MDKQKRQEQVEACAICAWRADCKKKFSLSGRNIRCPDFVKDLTIKDEGKKKDELPRSSQ